MVIGCYLICSTKYCFKTSLTISHKDSRYLIRRKEHLCRPSFYCEHSESLTCLSLKLAEEVDEMVLPFCKFYIFYLQKVTFFPLPQNITILFQLFYSYLLFLKEDWKYKGFSSSLILPSFNMSMNLIAQKCQWRHRKSQQKNSGVVQE